MTSKAPQQTEIENEIGLVPHAACQGTPQSNPFPPADYHCLSSPAPFREIQI